MWNKIYLSVLAIAVVPMIFLTYYSYSWLRSIGSPVDSIIGFQRASMISMYWLWISTAVLILIGNVILWSYRRAWAIWTTLLFLVVFLLLRAFWLAPASFRFIESHNLPLDTSVFGAFMTFITAAVATALVYFNQLLVVRMRDGIYPPASEAIRTEAEPAELTRSESVIEEDEKSL